MYEIAFKCVNFGPGVSNLVCGFSAIVRLRSSGSATTFHQTSGGTIRKWRNQAEEKELE